MKIKVKYVLSHPIQYFAPLIQRLAEEDNIDLHAVFATDAGAKNYFDPGFSREVRWDRPLLEGYRYSILNPGSEAGPRFMDIRAGGISEFIKKADTDVVITHGWSSHLTIGTMLTAFARKIPVLNRSDCTEIRQEPAPDRQAPARAPLSPAEANGRAPGHRRFEQGILSRCGSEARTHLLDPVFHRHKNVS